MHMQAYSNTHRLNRWPSANRETGGVVKEGQAEERREQIACLSLFIDPPLINTEPFAPFRRLQGEVIKTRAN